MYPVVIGNGRCLQSDAVVAGYHVPKGVSDYKSNLMLAKPHMQLIKKNKLKKS